MPTLKIKPTLNGEGGGGTTVVANPTLAGTEPDLTGLEVEGTKYKVPQGGGEPSVVELEMPNLNWSESGSSVQTSLTDAQLEALETTMTIKATESGSQYTDVVWFTKTFRRTPNMPNYENKARFTASMVNIDPNFSFFLSLSVEVDFETKTATWVAMLSEARASS